MADGLEQVFVFELDQPLPLAIEAQGREARTIAGEGLSNCFGVSGLGKDGELTQRRCQGPA